MRTRWSSACRVPRWSWQLALAVLVALMPVPVAALLATRQRVPAPAAALAPSPGWPPAGEALGIVVDGRPLPVAGIHADGVAFAPAAALASALGGFVDPAAAGGANIFLDGSVFTARLQPPGLDLDGRPVRGAPAPRQLRGHVYVPLDAVAAALGYAVRWPAGSPILAISTRPPVPAAPPAAGAAPTSPAPPHLQAPAVAADRRPGASAAQPAPVVPYTAADLTLMGRVVRGEADDEPYPALVGVAAVIINRVRTPGYPKSIPGVVYAPGQFQAVGSPLFERGPTQQDRIAVLAALHGQDPTGGALYFYNPAITWSGSWIFTRHTLATYGDIRFAR